MKKQVYNPFLPLNEYVPDGEPHVFGDRVYLYGSHDKAQSTRFCVNDYTVWSAPINDLSDWKCHGVTYKKSQDKRSTNNKLVDYYAPDCVQGNDGKYYLYYVAMGPNVRSFGPMSVAVSDKPEGPFEYLDDIHYKDGTPVLKFMNNDPAVINDNGRIWMYYGWGLGRDFRNKLLSPLYNFVLSKIACRSVNEIKKTKPSILSCAVVELESDMVTVKSEPKAVLDSKTTANKGSGLYKHPFYEAPSIRKFGDLYYLVYSSGEDNALAYATSKYPDRDFIYRGVIVSNSDLGYKGNQAPLAPAGTIHGGIEKINGKYYIFYHRLTNNTDFSRQACAELIDILPDGTIKQVEITSCGLNQKPLKGEGKYPAAICCNLTANKKIPIGYGKGQKYPRVDEVSGEVFVRDIVDDTQVGYKYFDFKSLKTISIKFRCSDFGRFEIRTEPCGEILGIINVDKSEDWTSKSTAVSISNGESALYLRYAGSGKIDLLEIEFTVK